MSSLVHHWRPGGPPDAWDRRHAEQPGAPASGPTLDTYFGPLRRHLGLLVLLLVLGGAAGAFLQARAGVASVATMSVFVPQDDAHVSPSAPLTIDTEAALVTSEPVLNAATTALGAAAPPEGLGSAISVTASPNTRILHISLALADEAAATKGVRALVDGYASMRREQAVASRGSALNALETRSDHIAKELVLARTVFLSSGSAPNRRLVQDIGRLRYQSRLTSVAIAGLSSQDVQGPQVAAPVTLSTTSDGWTVHITEGALTGLFLGIICCWLLDGRLARMKREARSRHPRLELPILARVGEIRASASQAAVRAELRPARAVLQAYAPLSDVLAVPGSAASRKVALALDAGLPVDQPQRSSRVLVVADTSTRSAEIERMYRSLRLSGQSVVGIVLVTT